MSTKRTHWFLLPLASLVWGCGAGAPAPEGVRSQANAQAAVAASAVSPQAAVAHSAAPALVWIEDDFARARDLARREKKAVFVDAWAPWCHSCLSMREFVLRDPLLTSLAGDYVFASIDTEREQNGQFVEAFPLRVWPTLFVIDPAHDKVLLQWDGSLSAEELAVVLREMRANAEKGHALAALLGADAPPAAVADYLAAHREPSVLRDHLADRHVGRTCNPKGDAGVKADPDACAREALAQLSAMTDGTTKWNVLATALGHLEKTSARLRDRVLAEAERLVSTPAPRVHGDDVSGVFEALCDYYSSSKQDAKTRALATRWATFLEAEAERAPAASAKSVYDAHRLLAYLALREPSRAIPMLQASVQALPTDYNPHARLARVYKELGRSADALSEIALATKLAYGPRALRIAALAADIREQSGDAPGAKREIDEAIARIGDMPLTASYKKLAADLRARSKKLGPPK